MPARLVYQDEGMSPGLNRLRDLVQVQRHPLGRAARQHQASALAREPGRSRRRCRPTLSFGLSELKGACRVWPSAA